jgi:hypothetical protein
MAMEYSKSIGILNALFRQEEEYCKKKSTDGSVNCQRRESSGLESGSFRAMNRPSVPNFEPV